MTFPVYGCSKPAMTRRIVVLPLPEAPSSTNASPSATSKEISSSTVVGPKRLLTARTPAAACGAVGLETEAGVIRSGLILADLATINSVSLECADLSALCQVATRRDHGLLESTQKVRRRAAVDQSGDRSPHSTSRL